MPAAKEVPGLDARTSEGAGAVSVHRGTHVARSEAFLPARRSVPGPPADPGESSRRSRAAAASPRGRPTPGRAWGSPLPSSTRASLSPSRPGSAKWLRRYGLGREPRRLVRFPVAGGKKAGLRRERVRTFQEVRGVRVSFRREPPNRNQNLFQTARSSSFGPGPPTVTG